jgi:diadenosine tetraphosphate (Ap4A) HIT family hydrolase
LGKRMLGPAPETVKRVREAHFPRVPAGASLRISFAPRTRRMSSPPCSICEQVAGRITAPGGAIYDDGLWLVSHHTGPHTDPGDLIVQLRRHGESLSELTPAEAAALGPILHAAVAAIERVVGPERTYVASYGERVRHVHFFLLPRTRSLPPGHVTSDLYRKARMQLRRFGLARNPSTEDRARVAGRLREDSAWRRSST